MIIAVKIFFLVFYVSNNIDGKNVVLKLLYIKIKRSAEDGLGVKEIIPKIVFIVWLIHL